MPQPGGSRENSLSKSISELQWSHETLLRILELVQRNGLLSEQLRECIIQMAKAAVLLEGLIQEHLVHARRRRSD